jgi:hypothetical protein
LEPPATQLASGTVNSVFHGAKDGAVCGKEMAKTRISHKLI